MQVSCSSCGAKYEFDASAIPAAGYDAQCTTCSAIFFVSPQADGSQARAASVARAVGPSAAQAPAPPTSPQVAVSCSHCGAVYQFAAADIPQEGYDAQCTQCQGVFFVSVAGAATVLSGAAPQGANAPSTPRGQPPADFSQVQDLPTVSDEDYASMSQVIAMERLQAQKRQGSEADGGGLGGSAPPSVAATPATAAELPATPTSSPEGVVSGEGAVAASAVDAPPEPAGAAPILQAAVSPAWGVVAPEMAALSGEPEALAAPTAALAANTPPSAEAVAEPIPGAAAPLPERAALAAAPSLVDEPGATEPLSAASVAPEALEAFSLAPVAAAAPAAGAQGAGEAEPSGAAAAAEPQLHAVATAATGLPAAEPPPPPPADAAPLAGLVQSEKAAVAADEPAFMGPSPDQNDAPLPGADDTQAEFRAPARRRRVWVAVASGAAVLALGGGAWALWRGGMLADEAAQPGATVAATAARPSSGAPDAALAAVKAVGAADPSKARLAFERGMHSLLDDTTAGYAAAQEAFGAALKMDSGLADAYAGLSLQALLSGTDYLALGHGEWAEAKRLEGQALAYQAKLLGGGRGRRSREAERERLALAELTEQLGQLREKAMLHLQIGEDTLQNGAVLLLRGSGLARQTPLMRASMALWLASDPYLANPGESTTSLNAARAQFTEAAQWLMAPGDEGASTSLPPGADAQDPWARPWLSLAKARILAANPTTAVQVQPVLESAIGREPHFCRGRWEIVQALALSGQKAAAQKAAESLLARVPTHEKARALVAAGKQADGAATLAAPKAAGKSRSRSHRGRRSRQ